MSRQSVSQSRAKQQLLALGSHGYPPALLGDAILEILDHVLPNNGLRLWLVDPGTSLLSRLLATRNDDLIFVDMWLRDWYLSVDDDRVPYFSSYRTLIDGVGAVSVHPEQKDSIGIPAHWHNETTATLHRNWFEETASPRMGWSYFGLPANGHWVAMLVTMHREHGTVLTKSGFRFLKSLQSIIGALVATSIRTEHLKRANRGDHAAGVVMVAQNGSVSFATKPGIAWMDRIHDFRGSTSDGVYLPTAIVSARNLLLQQQAAGVAAPVGRIRIRSADGPVRIEASVADDAGTVAIVISPEQSQGVPSLPDTWQLTGQEERIVQLLLTGAGNRQIAAGLFISEATVETHLSHIFEKLGVRNRTMVAGAFFRLMREPAL